MKHATLYYRVTPPRSADPISLCRSCTESALAKGYTVGKYSSDPTCVWCKKASDDKKAEKQRERASAKAGPTRSRR